MYYLFGCVMVCSSFQSPLLSKSMLAKSVSRRSTAEIQIGSHFRVFLVLAFIIVALVLAPEQPEQQASICKNHNPIAACVVW